MKTVENQLNSSEKLIYTDFFRQIFIFGSSQQSKNNSDMVVSLTDFLYILSGADLQKKKSLQCPSLFQKRRPQSAIIKESNKLKLLNIFEAALIKA